MIRKIIHINNEECNGCGLCADACHEGAIVIVGNKAQLLRDDYCDGLGDCLPVCPTGAITFVEREALEYNETAVKTHLDLKNNQHICGCPETLLQEIEDSSSQYCPAPAVTPTRLKQWPIQIKLVPVNAPFFQGADLLIAADCCAYAYSNFHQDFMYGKITLIGCPKLDNEDYCHKLTAIVENNCIKSLTVARMEVPCCAGIAQAVEMAVQYCRSDLPKQVVTISSKGQIK